MSYTSEVHKNVYLYNSTSELIFYITGERLSLLVTRTAPGLGNITVDWNVKGPLVHQTFPKISGTLFFAEVNIRWRSFNILYMHSIAMQTFAWINILFLS